MLADVAFGETAAASAAPAGDVGYVKIAGAAVHGEEVMGLAAEP